jgi:hypothetical protein
MSLKIFLVLQVLLFTNLISAMEINMCNKNSLISFEIEDEKYFVVLQENVKWGEKFRLRETVENFMNYKMKFFDSDDKEHINITKDNIIKSALNELKNGYIKVYIDEEDPLETALYFISWPLENLEFVAELCCMDKSFASTLLPRLLTETATGIEPVHATIISEDRKKGICEFKVKWLNKDERNLCFRSFDHQDLRINKENIGDRNDFCLIFLKGCDNEENSFDNEESVFMFISGDVTRSYELISSNIGFYQCENYSIKEISDFSKITDPKAVTLICLNNKNISNFPTNIDEFINLKILSLDYNLINDIPKNILEKCKNLKKLKLVSLANNPIKRQNLGQKFRMSCTEYERNALIVKAYFDKSKKAH